MQEKTTIFKFLLYLALSTLRSLMISQIDFFQAFTLIMFVLKGVPLNMRVIR